MRVAVIAATGIVLAAAYVVARRSADDAAINDGGIVDDAVNAVSDVVDVVTEGYLMPVNFNMQDANLQAFLRMVRYCEGTLGEDGYRTLFGGAKFASYADHPRKLIDLSGYKTTAAGAYQFLSKTWDEARAALNLPDFSPASQDAAAAWLIRRRGALGDVYAGRIQDAVRKCGKEWASLPGSPYGQPVKTMNEVQRVYLAAGGAIAGGPVYA